MVRRRQPADASQVEGKHRSFLVASSALSGDDIVSLYSGVISEGFAEMAMDPVYLSAVVDTANRLDRKRQG